MVSSDMKKIVSLLFVGALYCAASAGAWWGYSVNAGLWRPDNSDMKAELASRLAGNTPAAGSVYRDTGAGDLTFFMETNKELRFGFSLGYGLMAQAGLRENYTVSAPADSALKLDSRTAYFPLAVYGKYKPQDKPYSVWLGGGCDWIMADTDVMAEQAGAAKIDKTFSAQLVAPEISGGAEWFLCRNIALGFTAKYVFDARTGAMTVALADGNYKMIMRGGSVAFIPEQQALASGESLYGYDYGGFRAQLALRAYFGGPDK